MANVDEGILNLNLGTFLFSGFLPWVRSCLRCSNSPGVGVMGVLGIVPRSWLPLALVCGCGCGFVCGLIGLSLLGRFAECIIGMHDPLFLFVLLSLCLTLSYTHRNPAHQYQGTQN